MTFVNKDGQLDIAKIEKHMQEYIDFCEANRERLEKQYVAGHLSKQVGFDWYVPQGSDGNA